MEPIHRSRAGVSDWQAERDPEYAGSLAARRRANSSTGIDTLAQGALSVLEGYRQNRRSSPTARRAQIESGPEAVAVTRNETQQKLDRFMDRMRAAYTVNGDTVRVTPGFRMNKGYGPTPDQARHKISAMLPRGSVPLATIAIVTVGKGSPEQIARVTQALIDAGALAEYPASSLEQSIKKLMFAYGIGCDCSGYTFQAYAALRGTRFNPDVIPGRLVSRDAKDARPGDILRLVSANPDERRHGIVGSGHKAIVYSHVVRAAGDPAPELAGRAKIPDFFVDGGPLHVFEVDSSWGGGDRGNYGGVKREVLLFNESSGKWAQFSPVDGSFGISGSGPYNHILEGIFR